MPADRRFAVLIDADNVSGKYIKLILDEISKDGSRVKVLVIPTNEELVIARETAALL